MKALEILDYFRSEQIAYGCTPFLLEMYNEAIAELEALQPRSCESCKYQTIAEADCKTCSRYYRDEYEPKEQ